MHPRVELFGYQIDAIRMGDAVRRLLTWIAAEEPLCRYVVTPNVDHTVMLHERADFRKTYDDAGMILADGMPIVLASRLLKKPLPERVTGADLVYALFDAANVFCRTQRGSDISHRELCLIGANSTHSELTTDHAWQESCEAGKPLQRQLRVYLLGAGPGVAERAAANIDARWPAVAVVGTYSPPLGFEQDEHQNEEILGRIAAVQPDVVVVGLGAPKQELWVHRHRFLIQARVALCVGAAIDFLAGEKPRAPAWMQSTGLEWLYRLLSEPRRLARRYARDAWIFPRIVWNEWRQS